MKKEIEIIYTLEDKQEIATIKNCLNYCIHRIRKHGKTDKFLNEEVIENLRHDFGIFEKAEKEKPLLDIKVNYPKMMAEREKQDKQMADMLFNSCTNEDIVEEKIKHLTCEE